MSDFVTNLVGRSLSTLEVVRPRLPSLYEPHRRDTGPFFSARPGLGVRDGETGSERPPAGESSSVATRHRTPGLKTSQGTPAARGGRLAGHETEVQLSEKFERPNPASPSLAPHRELGVEPTIAEASLMASPSGDARTHGRGAVGPLGQSQAATHPVLQRHLRSLKSASSDLRMDFDQPAAPGAPAEPALLEHQAPPVSPMVRPPTGASLVAQEASVTPAVRRPAAPRPGRAGNTEVESNSTRPSVQVSIGKVDVRAVFPPQPPVHSVPTPRARPTVSLDDYLSQRHRGKR